MLYNHATRYYWPSESDYNAGFGYVWDFFYAFKLLCIFVPDIPDIDKPNPAASILPPESIRVDIDCFARPSGDGL